MGMSLALAGAAFAQQTEESPAAGGKKQGKEKATQHAEPKTPKTQGAMGEQGAEKGRKGKGANATGAMNEQGATGATTETGAGKGKKGRRKAETSAAAGTTGTEAGAGASVAPTGKGMREKGMKGQAGANAKASAAPSIAPAASAAPTVAATGAMGATGNVGAGGNVAAGGKVKADPQKVEQVKQNVQTIKQEHVNFKAQPRPDKVQAVTFNQNYQIQNSAGWSGPQYEVFRTYRPQWHDQAWYHSHYPRVELIAGGFYFFNAGYWYPA